MRRPCSTFIALALLVGAAAFGAEPPRPELLKLEVSTHSGPMPLDLELTGSLGDLDLSSGECVIRWDRSYVTPGHQALQERKEIPCLAAVAPVAPAASDGKNNVGAGFKQTLTLKEPGDYLIRIVFKQSDEKQVAGTTQQVKVYRGNVEVGATATAQQD